MTTEQPENSGYLTRVPPTPGTGHNHEPGSLSKCFNFCKRNVGRIIKYTFAGLVLGPIVLGMSQCAVNTDHSFFSYEAGKYAANVAGDGYQAEADFARAAARVALWPTRGLFGNIEEGGEEPEITYASTPHVKICIPKDLIIQVERQDPDAMSYHASVLQQVRRRVGNLNDPMDGMRQLNPNQDFVIVVHKRTDDFDPVKSDNGLQTLITTVPVHESHRVCPPPTIQHPTDERYRPEFETTNYEASWKFVPGLNPPGHD